MRCVALFSTKGGLWYAWNTLLRILASFDLGLQHSSECLTRPPTGTQNKDHYVSGIPRRLETFELSELLEQRRRCSCGFCLDDRSSNHRKIFRVSDFSCLPEFFFPSLACHYFSQAILGKEADAYQTRRQALLRRLVQ